VDHRHDRQLVYEWRQAGCRGFKLAKRMLDVSMKRDTSLCVDPRVDCLGRSEFGDNKSRTRHRTEFQNIASTLFHLDGTP
jgi:hypothetical protein